MHLLATIFTLNLPDAEKSILYIRMQEEVLLILWKRCTLMSKLLNTTRARHSLGANWTEPTLRRVFSPQFPASDERIGAEMDCVLQSLSSVSPESEVYQHVIMQISCLSFPAPGSLHWQDKHSRCESYLLFSRNREGFYNFCQCSE